MKLFQSEIQDPENYAIFYLDVFAESLVDRKPWQNSDLDWADPITVFKVEHFTHARMKSSKIKKQQPEKNSNHNLWYECYL